ncbi:hypothetical protein [Flexivirga meconopsidis]|nr:hypothetical protein [Flexivirga meconopsidis]
MNLEEITNDLFAQVDEGYVTGDETPAMTTPLAFRPMSLSLVLPNGS